MRTNEAANEYASNFDSFYKKYSLIVIKRAYNVILTTFSDTELINYVARAILAFLNKT